MNIFFGRGNKKNNLKLDQAEKKLKENLQTKDDVYVEINTCAFDFSLKCLNENYKLKNPTRI